MRVAPLLLLVALPAFAQADAPTGVASLLTAGALRSPSGVAYAAWTLSALILVGGVAMAVIGAMQLSKALSERRLAGFKIDLVDVELAKVSEAPAPPVP